MELGRVAAQVKAQGFALGLQALQRGPRLDRVMSHHALRGSIKCAAEHIGLSGLAVAAGLFGSLQCVGQLGHHPCPVSVRVERVHGA